MQQETTFDLKLAQECAAAFSGAAGVGCVVSNIKGKVLYEIGYSCNSCKMCQIINREQEICVQSQAYGMSEAERFGGKYIYFCPMGLTCFVSPILGGMGSEAKITVGPFLMVERQDYISCDLAQQQSLSEELLLLATAELERVPILQPDRVNQMSTLLFMAVGFMNNVSAANRMLETQSANKIQGQITAYIQYLKNENKQAPYPFDTERALLRAIAQDDKEQARRLLNELYGYIFFSAGGDFEQAKSRIYELLVLISRTAVDAGADPANALALSHEYIQKIPTLRDIDELCIWLTGVMDNFMDSVFNFKNAKHANAIHQSLQYINANYAQDITLLDMASRVYLSASYFSRVFKKETGTSFSAYLNKVRIEHSKEMLRHSNMRLTDISLQVGFDDQSYFTKVFKKNIGMVPLKYRESMGGLEKKSNS